MYVPIPSIVLITFTPQKEDFRSSFSSIFFPFLIHPQHHPSNQISMAHRTAQNHNQRRTMAVPDPDLNPPFQMDPVLKTITSKPNTKSKANHPKTAKTSAEGTNPDSLKSSSKTKPFYHLSNTQFSRLNLDNYKTLTSKKYSSNPSGVDIRLQAKALTVSADSDSSKFLLSKPSKKQQPQKTSSEKEGIIKKKSSKGGSVACGKKETCKKVLDGGKKVILVSDKDGKDLINEGCTDDVKRVSVPYLGRRRSFYGAHVELGDVMASCGVKVVSVDMPPFMQIHAFGCARKTYDSLEKFTAKTLALTLKKEFDGVYGPAWHCIVGTSFGSFVTHSVGGFLYFSMDQKLHILMFKTTVQRAD